MKIILEMKDGTKRHFESELEIPVAAYWETLRLNRIDDRLVFNWSHQHVPPNKLYVFKETSGKNEIVIQADSAFDARQKLLGQIPESIKDTEFTMKELNEEAPKQKPVFRVTD